MTNKKQQKGQNDNQKNSGGRAGSVTESTKKSEAGRERNRNERKLREKHRANELQNGSFYSRVNAGRSSDIDSAIRGQLGDYAFPGGNSPSVHMGVRREAFADGPLPVIRLESVQRGHELEGAVFDPKVYALCMHVTKYGLHFQSKFRDQLAASTQELIVHYLARQLMEQPLEVDVPAPSENLKAMLLENDGTYIVKASTGDVTFKVYNLGMKACIKVISSENPAVQVSDVFVPVYCLLRPTLEQVVPDEKYERQLAMFMFIRTELSGLIEEITKKPKKEVAEKAKNLSTADLEAIEKAADRRERKAKSKFVTQREEENKKMAILVMRQNCVPVLQIATGKLGYTDLSSSSGELIIGFQISGADRIARVEHMGDCHMLRLAGVEKGLSVFVSAIQTGKVERTHCKTEAEYRKRSILAEHIREQMEERGIRFKKTHTAA